jgi:hypothetical protein
MTSDKSNKCNLVGKYQDKVLLGIPKHDWMYDIIMHPRDRGFQNLSIIKTLQEQIKLLELCER